MRCAPKTCSRSAAGDNVVRLLPPLIISEPEIAEGVARLDRACARLSARTAKRRKRGAGRMSGVRHFLDLIDVPAADLRGMIDVGARHEGASAAAAPSGRSPARRWR